MIPLLFIVIWTVLFIACTYILWLKLTSHSKIYLLITCSGAFLSLIFWLFPMIKQIH
jgi:hypothetical protein